LNWFRVKGKEGEAKDGEGPLDKSCMQSPRCLPTERGFEYEKEEKFVVLLNIIIITFTLFF